MNRTTSLIRLGRTGGTTDADLRACASFVFCRPGWSVEEGVTGRGDTHIQLRTRGGEGGDHHLWRITRAGGCLTVVNMATREALSDIDTLREALIRIWEAETSGVMAA